MSEHSAEVPRGSLSGARRLRLKYQVFVSSTYVDLHEERERVVWAVLEARHIPAGMENFTATDERGWKTITRVIDDTDYYVLILGGLYGSIDPNTGISWTQREYEYATSKKIPVLAFIREPSAIPGNMVERDPRKMELLQKFTERVRANHLCKTWKTAEDLSAAVASALRNHVQDDEDDGNPRPGWIRGDTVPSVASLDEFARLSSENARLKVELDTARSISRLPILQLVGARDENTFQELTMVRPVLQWTAASQISANVANYLKQRSNTVWFDLAIKNSGPTAARNVTANFQFPDAYGVNLDLINPALAHLVDPTSDGTNPAKHVHVDSSSNTFLRQRIKLIAPGLTERLVRFGLEFDKSLPEGESSATCHYTLTDESGATERGQFIARLKWKGLKMVNALNLLPESPLHD
jgi:hypothetical protein